MILLVDHDDSFVFVLARYVEELGAAPHVARVGALTRERVIALAPSHIILSPGPGSPRDYPLTLDIIRRLGPTTPLLGVCLGHQCVAAAYGATVGRARHPRHGMASSVTHDGRGVFAGVPSPFTATRYHSLSVAADSVLGDLEISARADDGEVMGVRHRAHPVEGVQFHPESVLTEWGHRLLANFLGLKVNAESRAADGMTGS